MQRIYYSAHIFIEVETLKEIAVTLGLVLAPLGIAQASDPIASYHNAIEYCAGENTASLDDGVSPANVIAETLLAICRGKHYALYDRAVAARSR